MKIGERFTWIWGSKYVPKFKRLLIVLVALISTIIVFSLSFPRHELIKIKSSSVCRGKNLMFVKTHKCGTSTLVNLFYLYGVRNRLNFVIQDFLKPTKQHGRPKLYFSQRATRTMTLVPPRPGSEYNIQCQHLSGSFFPCEEHRIMPKETSLYTTIIRSPVSQFVSAFRFFGQEDGMRQKYSNGSLDDLIGRYLDTIPEPTEYEAPVRKSINSVANDLGWAGFIQRMTSSSLQEKINAFIKHLDQEMDLIMITDRLDESLIILKEYLCWSMTDILYLKRLVSGKTKMTISDKSKARISKYQVIDAQIFNHFNKSFQQKLDSIGRENVARQVEEFRKLREAFENKCFDKNETVELRFQSMSWKLSDYGTNKNLACMFLQTCDVQLTHAIAELQLSQDYTVPIVSSEGKLHNKPFMLQDMLSKIQLDYYNGKEAV